MWEVRKPGCVSPVPWGICAALMDFWALLTGGFPCCTRDVVGVRRVPEGLEPTVGLVLLLCEGNNFVRLSDLCVYLYELSSVHIR